MQSFNIMEEIATICKRHKDVLGDAVRWQWKQGLRRDDSQIGEYAAKWYADYKFQYKSELAGWGNVDLIKEGTTSDSITVEVTSDSLIFTIGNDPYNILTRYNDMKGKCDKNSILGLTPESAKAFVDTYLREELKQSFINKVIKNRYTIEFFCV